MGDLRFEHPSSTEDFEKLLEQAGAPLPWTHAEDGSLFDANRLFIGVADQLGDVGRSDAECHQIAILVELAVNTCGGFKRAKAP